MMLPTFYKCKKCEGKFPSSEYSHEDGVCKDCYDLKPCPFCGSRAMVSTKHKMYRVECLNRWGEEACPMNMRTHHKAAEIEAKEAWNTRV